MRALPKQTTARLQSTTAATSLPATSLPNSFTQSAKMTQSNKITSSIAVKNSGHVEAADTGSATDAGIAATIVNDGITQTNTSEITTNSGGDVTADSFTQSAEVDQSNQITSSIAVENSGHVEGDNIGIAATIINAQHYPNKRQRD